MSSPAKWEPLKDAFNRERSTSLALGHSICSSWFTLAIQRQLYLYIYIYTYILWGSFIFFVLIGHDCHIPERTTIRRMLQERAFSCNSLDHYLAKLGDTLKYDDHLKKNQGLHADRNNQQHTHGKIFRQLVFIWSAMTFYVLK